MFFAVLSDFDVNILLSLPASVPSICGQTECSRGVLTHPNAHKLGMQSRNKHYCQLGFTNLPLRQWCLWNRAMPFESQCGKDWVFSFNHLASVCKVCTCHRVCELCVCVWKREREGGILHIVVHACEKKFCWMPLRMQVKRDEMSMHV